MVAVIFKPRFFFVKSERNCTLGCDSEDSWQKVDLNAGITVVVLFIWKMGLWHHMYFEKNVVQIRRVCGSLDLLNWVSSSVGCVTFLSFSTTCHNSFLIIDIYLNNKQVTPYKAHIGVSGCEGYWIIVLDAGSMQCNCLMFLSPEGASPWGNRVCRCNRSKA